MTAALSRRSALGALARFTALAVPGVAVAAPSVADNPDAALSTLLVELRQLNEEAKLLRQACATGCEEFMTRVSLHGYEEACRWSNESGHEQEAEASADCDQRLDALLDRMRAIKPQTLTGLAALAEAMKLDHLDRYWRERPNDRDCDKLLVTELFDMVIGMGDGGGSGQRPFS